MANVLAPRHAAAAPAPHGSEIDPTIREIVRAARKHLDLEAAFLSQLQGGERIFRVVDSESPVITEGGQRSSRGVNVSPATLTTPQFAAAVASVPPGRLTVEITEHAAVEDYCALRVARDDLRARGVRLAIDDVGMGFSELHHIIESEPDSIKIDVAVVRDVDSSLAKAAMIEALVAFGRRTGVLVIAEGIATEAELTSLRAMGVAWGRAITWVVPVTSPPPLKQYRSS